MIGIVFGCFIPLHIGHKALIDLALEQNDHVIIAVCGYDNDRGKDFLPFRTRVQLMKEKYANDNKVTVVQVDDKKLGLTGTFSINAWTLWCNELFNNANINPYTTDCTWYTGEQSYKDKISVLYPNHKFYLANRDVLDISGTKIRNNPYKYSQYIDSYFYDYLLSNNII